MAFVYARVIRFHETDAAGVVYFANLLTLCHEAYEAALDASGVVLKDFFSGSSSLAVPIVHTEADYYGPLQCGDAIAITLIPKQLGPHSFEVAYQVRFMADQVKADRALAKPLAQALTRHVCISVDARSPHPLTAELLAWIDGRSGGAKQGD